MNVVLLFYKLEIRVKNRQRKVTDFLWKFCMWFSYVTSLRHFPVRLGQKFVSKENSTVVGITSSWSFYILRSYKLVKAIDVPVSNSTDDLGMWPWPSETNLTLKVWLCKASESSANLIYKTAYFNKDCVNFLSKVSLD